MNSSKNPRAAHTLFAIYTLPVVVSIFVLAVAFLVYQRSQIISDQKQYYENQLESYYLDAMQDAVWDFRLSDIEKIASQVNEFPYIAGVEVLYGENDVVVSLGNTEHGNAGDVYLLDTLSINQSIDWRVKLYQTEKKFDKEIVRWIVQIALLLLIVFVAVWLVFKWSFDQFIRKPSLPLRSALRSFDLDSTKNTINLPLNGSSEVVELIAGYNEMASLIYNEQLKKKHLDLQTSLHFTGLEKLSHNSEISNNTYLKLIDDTVNVLLREPDSGLVVVSIGDAIQPTITQSASNLEKDQKNLKELERILLDTNRLQIARNGLVEIESQGRQVFYQRVTLNDEEVGCLFLESISAVTQTKASSHLFLASISRLVALIVESKKRVAVEQHLAETKSTLFTALDKMSMGISLFDSTGCSISQNPSATQFLEQLGCSKSKGVSTLPELTKALGKLTSSDGNTFRHWISEGSYESDFEIQVSKNKWITISGTVQEDRAVNLFFRDTTQQKLIANSIQHDEKIKTLGRFSSGIMHDLNIFLQSISNNIELTLAIGSDDSTGALKHRAWLKSALESCDNAANMSQQLLNYSRKTTSFIELIDIESTVRSLCESMSNEIGRNIELKVDVHSTRYAYADKYLFDRAITNIINNSIYASEGKALVLLLTLSNVASSRSKKQYVSIRIQDNCGGFHVESLSKLVEPFYTSKRHGDGNGLGLFLVNDFIMNSNGELYFKNEGEGAEVELILPSIENVKDKAVRNYPESKVSKIELTGYSVLIVEDSEDLARIIRFSLELMGAKVFYASKKGELKGCLQTMKTPPDFILSDINLPDGSGFEAYDYVRKYVGFDLPHIFMTGDPNALNHHEKSNKLILKKPFSIEELYTIISEFTEINGV